MSHAKPSRSFSSAVTARARFKPTMVVLALSSALTVSGNALATDWAGTTNDWFTDTNWANPAVAPGAADNVFINTNTTAIVGAAGALANNLLVGDSALGTLEVSGGGTLTSNGATLGNLAGGDGQVLVTGAGSSWDNTNAIFLGVGGAGTLDIQAGGTVTVGTSASLGFGANTTGTATVDGAGSTLTITGTLNVGDAGAGTLTITNGGAVNSGTGTIGNAPGSVGMATVDGSTWTSTGNITVGGSGDGTLDILAGGVVTNVNGEVGAGAGGQGTVTVDGTGSTWTNTGTLAVGVIGAGTLNIQNGGLVTTTAAFIGDFGATGAVTVDGATGASTFTSTGSLAVGFTGNGTLDIVNGGAVNSNSADIGSQNGSVGAVTIDGTGSIWTNTLQLTVGNAGTGTLDITNGGELVTGNAFVGGAANGTGTVTVAGPGSKWTNATGIITIGDAGTGTLNISNGGVVSGSQGFIGAQAGSTGTVTVDGAASFWNNSSNIRVGALGNGTLSITNGGTVSSAGASIGDGLGGVGVATVDNSTWNITGAGGNLQVGLSGNGTLNIVNGGEVNNAGATLGINAGSQGTATVNGPGSLWMSSGKLTVGGDGTGALTISGGGAVTSATGGDVAAGVGSTGTVLVDGNASNWFISGGSLNVGGAGTGLLTVQNSALVTSAGTVVIGNAPGGVGTVNVSGNGSALAAATGLTVGNDGTGFLNITGGGTVNNATGAIGATGGTGTVLVDGAGSSWMNTGTLAVGGFSTGVLTLSNGGVVGNSTGSLGLEAGSSGTVTVTGAGSKWTNTSTLDIGDLGTGTLAIAGGGAVSNTDGTIGKQAGSTGTATVDGAGSAWTNTGDLVVGALGTGSLAITNGGVVGSVNGTVGQAAGVSSAVIVDGAASKWTNTGDLMVADAGTGTLAISNGGAVKNGFGLIANQAGATGSVSVDGAGSTWTNGFGVIVGNNGAGTLTIANGGTVTAANIVFIGSKAGSTGALNIGGAAGLAATAPGTLTAPLGVQFGAGTGMLNFNHTDTTGAYAFGAAISGLGTINHVAGWTNLTGDASAFTGQTNITGGRLAVNGTLGGTQVNVSSTGILGGTGTVGNTVANAGGIIAPGNSIGTLKVNGDVTFNAGSVYQVEANALGQSDSLQVSGAAMLNGGMVQVIATNGNYSPTTSYSILTTTNGVNGTFGSVTADLAYLDPSLNYGAKDVTLTLTRNNTPIGAVGQTPGQVDTGNGVESLGNTGVGGTIYNAVLGLSVPQARLALQQLSGEVHASARGVQFEDSRFARDASLERLRALDSDVVANDGGADAADGKPARLLPSVRDLAYWARAMGSWGHINGDGGTATIQRDTSGFLMGADTRVGDEGRFGLMGGYSRSAFEVSDSSASGRSDNYHLGAYAGNRWGDLALRTGVSYSWHDVSTGRSVAFPGFTDSLSADYKASSTQAFAELGYRIRTEQAEFEPFANLARVKVSSDGFTERGGLAALTSAGNSSGVTFSTVGLRASTKVAMGGADVTARGSIGWRHAFGDVTPSTSVAFAGGATFVAGGAPIARSAAVVEAGLDFRLSNAATLGLSYGGQFGSGLRDHSARANLNVAF